MKHFLQELRFCKVGPQKWTCDNQSALYLSSKTYFLKKTIYIKVDCHFLEKEIHFGVNRISSVSSKDHIAITLPVIMTYEVLE